MPISRHLLFLFIVTLFCLYPDHCFAQTPPGRWRNIYRPNETRPLKPDITDLRSLPYLQGYYLAPEKNNVTKFDKKLSQHGINLYSSGHGPEAFLMDMKGNVLHKWRYDITAIMPKQDKPFWERLHLFENGDLLAINSDSYLTKMDKDSNLIWFYKCECHHDMDFDENNNIYILESQYIKVDGHTILDNLITTLSPEGKFIESVSLFELLQKSQYNPQIMKAAADGDMDVFHTNTLEIFNGDLADLSSLYKKGNALVSILNLNIIAIINLENKGIVWTAGPEIWQGGQHHPTLLENGNMLIFENGWFTEKSRIIEFNPLTKETVWQYVSDKRDAFYTKQIGANQRLLNGNTLITESNKGRAFEITPQGKLVWEFFSPHRAGEDDELIATLVEIRRLPSDFPIDWVNTKN